MGDVTLKSTIFASTLRATARINKESGLVCPVDARHGPRRYPTIQCLSSELEGNGIKAMVAQLYNFTIAACKEQHELLSLLSLKCLPQQRCLNHCQQRSVQMGSDLAFYRHPHFLPRQFEAQLQHHYLPRQHSLRRLRPR
mmetsp:Transcript_23271/g.50540  ORF Transcript_23271/g.50540 Transcript_23271/m.50540 type:complete len:140 (+) Transcript_23271:117-536(+)